MITRSIHRCAKYRAVEVATPSRPDLERVQAAINNELATG